MKKIQTLFLCVAITFSTMMGTSVSANENITVNLNGQKLNFDVQPQIIDGRTMVPMRKIFEELGAVVVWGEKDQEISAYTESCAIHTKIGGERLSIRKDELKTVDLDVPPMIIGGRTLVPVRFIAEALDAAVEWDEQNNAVNISSNNIPETKPAQLIYDNSQCGNVTGVVTYQYNKYVGTKPDVGADILLIQTNHTPLYSDAGIFLSFSEIANYDEDPMIYCTEVDGMGNYYLDNIPAGYYYLLILSKETNQSPEIEEMNAGLIDNYFSGKITAEAIERLKLKTRLNSFEFETIEVKANQTTRFSKDFGYTYY